MPAPVALVTVHHEGAGAPSDVARGAEGGYTYWIGSTYWTHLRDVWSSYATLDLNGESVDVCLSGNRMEHAVTDADLDIIAGACADARARGYVIDDPQVRAHRDSPGSSTVCPGDLTMAVWDRVVAACVAGDTSSSDTTTSAEGAVDIKRTPSGSGYYIVAADGGVFCYGDAKFYGSAAAQQLHAPIVGLAAVPNGTGYWLAAQDGGVFAYGSAKFHGGMSDEKLAAPITGIESDNTGNGYWLLGRDGGVFAFGDAKFYGSPTGKVE
jgi:hypothetical protein